MTSWMDLTWPMMAAACLTLGSIHGFVWLRHTSGREHLPFAVAAFAVAALTMIELFALRATTPGELGTLIRWMHVPITLLVLALIGLVHTFLDRRFLALGLLAGAIRAVALVLNFTTGENLNFMAVDAIHRQPWWGNVLVSYPVGPANPWIFVGQASNAVLIAYLLLSFAAAWRGGDAARRRSALIVSASWLFVLAAMLSSAIVFSTHAGRPPFIASPVFLLVIVATSWQLGVELSRSVRLANELRESQLRALTSAGDLVLAERAAAQEREAAAERFRNLFACTPVAILLVDGGGRIALANDVATQVFALRREALEGSLVESLLPERFRDGHVRLREEFLADPRLHLADRREVQALRADGIEIPVEISLKPIALADGDFLLTTVVDITARKRAEIEATQQRDELAHLSRVAMIGELSGSLAHELNQPLMAILSNAQAAQRLLQNDAGDLTVVREILADIVVDDRRAGEVIKRMRMLLKKGHVDHAPVELNALVVEVLRLIRSDLIHRGVEAHVDLVPGPLEIDGDPVQLQQVLVNLIFNASDAMEACAGKRIVTVRSARPGAGVARIEVEDGGTGIPADMLERIFEPFETTKAQGMGLGLAVCRTILQSHGGRIWAENVAAGGARVCLEITRAGSGP